MALIIKKSMDVSNFWESWKLIIGLVADEYNAVKGNEGFYDLKIEIIWDCLGEEVINPRDDSYTAAGQSNGTYP